MHRTNTNGNQRNHPRSQLVSNVAEDDSRSQVDSETSVDDEAIEEERSPFVPSGSNDDVDEYVKRLRKSGTADKVSSAALTQGMGMIAVKTGAAYLARFGRMSGKGDDIVDEDDIIGGGATVATKLNPSQQQVMNQMAPQASGAAAGGIAAPMMSVVVPTPIGSAAASSAAATTAAASQAAVVATTAATVAAAASVAASGMFAPSEQIFPASLQNGTIPSTYIHETGNGVKREFLPLLETSFEEAYVDMFRDTVISPSFEDCNDRLEGAKLECLIVHSSNRLRVVIETYDFTRYILDNPILYANIQQSVVVDLTSAPHGRRGRYSRQFRVHQIVRKWIRETSVFTVMVDLTG